MFKHTKKKCDNSLHITNQKKTIKMLDSKTALYVKWLQKRIATFTHTLKDSCHKENRLQLDDNEMKITKLRIDCLQKVFNYLDVDDLLNVADSNKYLKKAAQKVFAKRYGSKILQLHGMQPSQNRILSVSDTIFIKDVRSSLQMLRCFGHLVSQLEISDEYSNTFYGFAYEFILKYVNTYCAASLKHIKFYMIPSSKAFQRFKMEFSRMKSVEIICCKLNKKMMPMDKLFPNVQQLIIDFTAFEDYGIIEKPFPHLKHLVLGTSMNNVAAVLQLNSQLISFETKCVCSVEILRKMSDRLKWLESLDIVCDSDELKYFNGDAFYFPNVKQFKLNFSHSRWTLPRLPFEFQQLKEFTMLTNHKLNDEFRNFINKHPTIVTLDLPSIKRDDAH